ncbi:MAG TPA: endopeptidase La [Acidimicrobiia bacterium]|nr:endopeptidase La [Acidimicrobiia bacterium]
MASTGSSTAEVPTAEDPTAEDPTAGNSGSATTGLGGIALPVLPLSTGVVLPNTVATLTLDTDEARAAVAAATEGDGRLLLVPRIDGRFARVGTVAKVEESGELPNGAQAAILRGEHRARLGAGVTGAGSALWVEATEIQDPEPAGPAAELGRELRGVLSVLAERRRSRRLPELLRSTVDPGALADGFGAWSDLPPERTVELLETVDVEARVGLVLEWARESLAEHEVADRIRTEVGEGMERQQREFLLRRQLAAIREELGEGDDGDAVGEYRRRASERDLPDHVRTALDREIDRLERTGEQSPEQGWIRTWLDTILELPWDVRSDAPVDIAAARAVLDADHTGLDDVKQRIVEALAVAKLRAERGVTGSANGLILALVGPPGVGKTSLGESVARATGRKFVRVALGGARDEAEIRGHRRTYVGAAPGRIARALTEAGTMNPVVLLDEVDKVGADWRGDPTSALLEVLDPAQNHTFRDHYLEVDLDLSDVLFLATANVVETIPAPLLDRMEVVRLDGYTEDEKVAIARDHLFARQRAQNGLTEDEISLADDALRSIVTDYTREAGVRNLERELAKLVRKVAAMVVASGTPEGSEDSEASGSSRPSVSSGSSGPLVIEAADLGTHLGRTRFFSEQADERTTTPGTATGLAVTGAGGDVLFVEASAVATGKAGDVSLTLTGQLGDVMKESAEIALTYVRAHADELGVDPTALDGRRFHVHVPAGAVPKDGPSAGVTMTTALVSLLTGRPVIADVGMTGEMTLAGRVLPIGGVKQKVLAAQRAGLTTVVLPARNGPDLDDVPEAVRDAMTFRLASTVDEVLGWALEPPSEPPSEPLLAA